MFKKILDGALAFMILAYVALVAVAPFALVGSIVAIAIAMWTS